MFWNTSLMKPRLYSSQDEWEQDEHIMLMTDSCLISVDFPDSFEPYEYQNIQLSYFEYKLDYQLCQIHSLEFCIPEYEGKRQKKSEILS